MRQGDVKPFNLNNVKQVPEIGGIYAIYDLTAGGVAYIGKSNGTNSSNIYTRLKHHVNGTGSKVIKELIAHDHDLWFSFTSSDNPSGAEAAELARLSPPGNKRGEWSKLEDFDTGDDDSGK
jgi:hypothetical protein